MELRCLLLNIVFISVVNAMLAFGTTSQDDRRCSYGRIEKLTRIRCHKMDLKEVPQNLKTSVEVLDLSFNRIKKLKSGSFQRYSDIKFLMLYENMILSVEPGTFAPLTSLQEIDLSSNGLTSIPVELFSMPRLRNLYVDSNELKGLHQELQTLEKPIRAPLEYLNVANCELDDIPDLGTLPNLWQLNASMNPLKEFSIDKLANLCHLSVIDLTRTQISTCDCHQVTNHLMTMGANPKYVPVCMGAIDSDVCPLPYNRTVDSSTFSSCLASAELAETRSFWLFAAGCCGGVALVLLVFCYCVYRWRKKRTNRRLSQSIENRKRFVISPRNAINNRLEDQPLHCDTASA
ncbi:leucine-rich repeat-containing protein 4B [Drosophila grimshawi]|uniref:GH21858 n=1 Tax=Drosophila grimshawi TaxID=7222 RepID=B4J7N9_DROGR|nr:leucine-rich repeat-containing protein 4B [Drosophila grimshawi]EDW02187.1 GH21858 [Drosophila grimshawi]